MGRGHPIEPVPPVATRREGLAGFLERIPFGWKMALPLVLLLGAVVLYPLGYSLWISLTDYTLTARRGDWVGFEQYSKVISGGRFGDSLRITMVFVVIAVTVELVLGLVIALALSRQRWARNVTRAFLFTPMFIAPVAVGLTFRYLLNSQLGIIPEILDKFGITISFFSPDLALFSMAAIDVWQWTPFMVLMLLAGLESRPREPFEAARVDGASEWLTFRLLTLRMLLPVITVAVLVRALEATKLFEYVFVITNGGPGGTTESLQFLMYQTGIRFFRLAEASAMAFVFLAILLIPIVLLFVQLRRTER